MQLRTDTLGHRCQWLGIALGALWLLTFLPARYFFGTAGIQASAISAVSCLLAGWVTFLFVERFTQPQMQAFSVLFGTVIRGAFALAAALLMQFLLGLAYENYLIWLGVFYLAALALETALLLNPPKNATRPESNGFSR